MKKYLKWIIIGTAVILVVIGGIFLVKHFVSKKEKKIEPKELISLSKASIDTENLVIIAHRGLSAIAPENTVYSIQEAKDAGLTMVEFDISESRDGTPVLMHDNTVDRMTDGKGKVNSFTYYELLKLKFDNGANIEKYDDVRIATAEEILEICDSGMITPVIEFKDVSDECAKKVFQIIEDKALPTVPIIISFDGEKLARLKKEYPDYKYMYLVSEVTDESIQFCKDNGMGIDFEASKNTDEVIKKVLESELDQVACWTVDDIEQLKALIDLGVRLITSNVFVP
ncbi:MAG: hypothetical protein K5756_06470 [Clostridiales bacterium]|nr:hypothetical protein [Clostridiales bacterium]